MKSHVLLQQARLELAALRAELERVTAERNAANDTVTEMRECIWHVVYLLTNQSDDLSWIPQFVEVAQGYLAPEAALREAGKGKDNGNL